MLLVWIILIVYAKSILLESIPDCSDISLLYRLEEKDTVLLITPYYLLSCYSAPHKTLLQDMARDNVIRLSKRNRYVLDLLNTRNSSYNHNRNPAFFFPSLSPNSHLRVINPFVVSILKLD